MARGRQERRSRQWWIKAVQRWRRSRLTAEQFAKQEGLAVSTLRWWSSELGRGTRAKREPVKPVPLEVRVDGRAVAMAGAAIEVEADGVLVRVPVGVDAAYVASLARLLGRAS